MRDDPGIAIPEERTVSAEARVVSLHRYPIKGLCAESLDSVALTAGRGFPHDRAWGFARHGTDFDPAHPAPLPKTKFLMLARDERLASLDTRFDPATAALTITTDAGETSRFDMGTETGRDAASAFLADLLELGPERAPRFVSAGRDHRFTDVSVVSGTLMHAVSLLNLASVRDLEARTGRTVEPERFRANLVVDGLEPWAELELEGRDVRVGDVRMRGVLRTRRCAATEINPDTARRDVRVPRLLLDELGHADMGVYLEVRGTGTSRPGDPVRVDT